MGHFEMIKEINIIKFNRVFIIEDAILLDIDDANKGITCSVIHLRFKRRSDNYSCQLIFSHSKLLPKDISQPRAEVFTATRNTHTGHFVRRIDFIE